MYGRSPKMAPASAGVAVQPFWPTSWLHIFDRVCGGGGELESKNVRIVPFTLIERMRRKA